ncbi:hypothetical protein [Lacinutrix himadriensis]|uniref:hypothetical protein n=1 Tax=Lacinutrix himadriensis TaxID=641549 RepID=UPI0006E2CF2F|nr:hypothetical protein [Lacinutrix himadriensis]
MKKILLVILSAFCFSTFAQSEKLDGNYNLSIETENASFTYTLILQQDGTFIFHSYTNNKQAIPPESNTYGKGTWTSEKNIITFSANPNTDFNEKHTLDFNNSKARFISKSPRDKSDKVVKTRLQFYKSDIFWMQGKELLKQ